MVHLLLPVNRASDSDYTEGARASGKDGVLSGQKAAGGDPRYKAGGSRHRAARLGSTIKPLSDHRVPALYLSLIYEMNMVTPETGTL